MFDAEFVQIRQNIICRFRQPRHDRVGSHESVEISVSDLADDTAANSFGKVQHVARVHIFDLFRQPVCPDVIVEYSGDGENPVVVYELPFIVKLAVICHEGLDFLRFGAGGIAEIDAKQIADPSCAVHPCRQRSPMADLANDAGKGSFNAIVERFFEGLGEKYTGVS